MITKETIRNLAILSRLEFTEDELAKYTQSMDDIFNYANLLKNIETSHVAPSSHAIPIQNVFREDFVIPYENIDKILSNAPEAEAHSFVVPQILAD